jgi:hypothetical protein
MGWDQTFLKFGMIQAMNLLRYRGSSGKRTVLLGSLFDRAWRLSAETALQEKNIPEIYPRSTRNSNASSLRIRFLGMTLTGTNPSRVIALGRHRQASNEVNLSMEELEWPVYGPRLRQCEYCGRLVQEYRSVSHAGV